MGRILAAKNGNAMRRLFLLTVFSSVLLSVGAQEAASALPHADIPDDHLAYFGLHGAVREVREYDYGGWGKTIWRFDPQGRLTEYIDYGNPFFGSGGCVFGLLDHYPFRR